MKEKNLSIVIPVYNGAKYINKICEQLSNQTYQNFMVYFIDDCSTDNSYEILKENEKKYSFICVLKNSKNCGAGYSRNRAIEKITTPYTGFLDCDDEIPDNYFKELMKAIKKENSDMALCDVKISYAEGFEDTPDFYNCVCHSMPVQKKDILNNDVAAGAWNKIIKTEIIKENLFSEGIINEDIPAIIGCIIDAKKIAYTNKTFYTYIQRKSSVQNGTKISKKFDVFKAFDELEKRKQNNVVFKRNRETLIYHQLILFLIYGIIMEKNIPDKGKYLKEFEQLAEKYNYRQNKCYWNFIDSQRIKVKLFYKVIIKLMKWHLFGLASFVSKLYEKYINLRNKFCKKVLKYDITMEDLKLVAKKNQKHKELVSISVVIPNYNYEQFLFQRLYSILYQNVKIKEIIILDDCSTDNSREIIDKIEKELKKYVNIKKVYNDKNSGSPFKQWQKGFELSTSSYVWIAEADDYSHPNFLKEVLKPLNKDSEICLSYCDTSYIYTNGIVLTKTVEDLIDIMETNHWSKNYINDGQDEIKNYEFLNCTIANVSSVIFKKDNYKKDLKEAGTYKQCGDWYFYFSVMKRGKVAYSTKPYNYCRLHGSNSTTNLKKQIHYNEIKKVQSEIQKEFSITKKGLKEIKKRLTYLRKVWELPKD